MNLLRYSVRHPSVFWRGTFSRSFRGTSGRKRVRTLGQAITGADFIRERGKVTLGCRSDCNYRKMFVSPPIGNYGIVRTSVPEYFGQMLIAIRQISASNIHPLFAVFTPTKKSYQKVKLLHITASNLHLT